MMTLIAVLHFAPHKWSFLSAAPHSFCGLVHISEMVFPEYGVHFIAVNDGVDSIKGDSEFTAIRNVFNEMFAKDTSKKIKATWAIRSFQDQQAIVQEQKKGLE